MRKTSWSRRIAPCPWSIWIPQVAGYPCPVGTADFTRAVNQGKKFDTYLRTQEDDRFALAVLLFKVLLPGKHPFSHAGGEGPAENIRAGRFPYAFGERRGGDVPDGPWRAIWSHLSHKVKAAFSACFADQAPKSAAAWAGILSTYRRAIEGGFMDREGGDAIFPALGKRVSEEAQRKHGFTQAAMLTFTCGDCLKPFAVKADSVTGQRSPDRCSDCRKASRLAAERRGVPNQRPRPAAPSHTGVARPPGRTPTPMTPRPGGSPASAGSGLLGAILNLIIGRT